MTSYQQAAGDEKEAGYEEKSNTNANANENKAGPPQATGISAPFKWFWANPLKRYPFAIFVFFGILTFLWLILYFTASTTGYVMAGVAAVLMSCYGANHFRILLGLKEQVDKMSNLNREFRGENAALKTEVDKLSKAKDQLNGVEVGLRDSNRKLKENVEKFKQLDRNLKKLSDSNIKGLAKLQQSSQAVMNTMSASLIRHEKDILYKVFQHMQLKDNHPGLTEEEFNDFLDALPESYRERFRASGDTFASLAGKDNVLDIQEFRQMVDKFAELEAEAGGSQ
jgi:hypothetical protein